MLVGNHTSDTIVLRHVGFGRFLELEQAFNEPELHYIAARMPEPDPARLFRRLYNRGRRLIVWDIERRADGQRLGYATVYQGVRATPNIYAFMFTESTTDTAIAGEVIRTLAQRLFDDPAVNAVDCLYPIPVPPSLDRDLTDCGFDVNEHSEFEPELEVCYTLERATYDAYKRAQAP